MDNVFKQKSKDPADLLHRAVVVELAQRLGVGQYGSQTCPSCEGGATRERSMSLAVEPNGVIKFHCHRAACGFSGQAYTTPGLAPHRDTPVTPRSSLTPLTADLFKLSDREIAWFKDRFHLSEDTIERNIKRTETRYALPLWTPQGVTRGWITRRPWEGSPADTEDNRKDPMWSNKALTYMELEGPVLSWYGKNKNNVILVEDPISAMRLAEQERSAVALMGTGVNGGKIAELQRTAALVTVALDADATGQAFAMARKWGQAFDNCRVVVLSKDIKDCSDDELAELPL